MVKTAQQSGTSRRALRDLVPVTLATVLAGFVVALLVGGTTAGIRSTLGPSSGSGAVPSFAAGAIARDRAAAAGEYAGVSVRVRPSLPPPLPIVSAFDAFDLAPAPAPVEVSAPVVRGVSLTRTPAVSLAASPPLSAPSVSAPEVVVAASSGVARVPLVAAPVDRADAKTRATSRVIKGTKESAERKQKDRDGGQVKRHDAPPDQAVAKGRVGR